MAFSSGATRSSQQPDQITQQLTGHLLNLLPITPNLPLSLCTPFCLSFDNKFLLS